ncbi:MAG TPA: aminotransferase class I/II-fold pyridoxal phosphate-dependent enzyme [Candidatus Eisenbacteria bacterium]|nr:aminotransferase class I/II-fold pyridoxal phosphate-dependent enzyme [Candidatus Eisenbacteria bacterium]
MSRSDGAGRRQPATRAVHGPNPAHGPMSTPIVHSTTYSFPSLDAMNEAQDRGQTGAYYQRLGHPTIAACEARLADLEGAERSLLFASGVAALACTFLACLSSGDHVVALEQSYGGTHDLFKWGVQHFGWRCEFVDARAPETWERAFRPETRLLHVESPTNPILAVVDIERAAKLAHARGARLSVDNTFASPVGQQPLAFGADFVVTSATKSIGGHADVLAGLVSGSARALEPVWKARKIFGPILDPEAAWRIERSLKTLPLRTQAANANALELASRLAAHGAVAQVFYPGLARHPGHDVAKRQMTLGFGPVLAFEVRGGAPAAEALVNALKLVHHAVSLGGVESLASLPAYTSHIQLGAEGRARAGIPEGLVRLSVGIEDVNDLWADLTQALEAAVPARVG